MKKLLYNGITFFILFAIVYLSLTSRPIGVKLAYMDKFQHALAYFVLAFFMNLSARSWGVAKRSFLVTMILCAIIGGALEIIQSRYGRMMEWGDFASDVAGAFLGCLAVTLISSRTSKPT